MSSISVNISNKLLRILTKNITIIDKQVISIFQIQ